jgi:hypothetical protein
MLRFFQLLIDGLNWMDAIIAQQTRTIPKDQKSPDSIIFDINVTNYNIICIIQSMFSSSFFVSYVNILLLFVCMF